MLTRTSSIALIAALVATLAAALAADARAASPALEPARFSLTIDGYEIAAFSQLAEVAPGTLVLRRGSTTTSKALWAWHEAVLMEQAAAKDAVVVMYDTAGKPVARYHLENAWPSKVEIGALKSDSNEVAIEGITLCHEGFEIR
jgi:T4-like virus tail tube protein gp19